MVTFETKNPNLGKFLVGFAMEDVRIVCQFGIFYSH
jgi:hypothetical protein